MLKVSIAHSISQPLATHRRLRQLHANFIHKWTQLEATTRPLPEDRGRRSAV